MPAVAAELKDSGSERKLPDAPAAGLAVQEASANKVAAGGGESGTPAETVGGAEKAWADIKKDVQKDVQASQHVAKATDAAVTRQGPGPDADASAVTTPALPAADGSPLIAPGKPPEYIERNDPPTMQLLPAAAASASMVRRFIIMGFSNAQMNTVYTLNAMVSVNNSSTYWSDSLEYFMYLLGNKWQISPRYSHENGGAVDCLLDAQRGGSRGYAMQEFETGPGTQRWQEYRDGQWCPTEVTWGYDNGDGHFIFDKHVVQGPTVQSATYGMGAPGTPGLPQFAQPVMQGAAPGTPALPQFTQPVMQATPSTPGVQQFAFTAMQAAPGMPGMQYVAQPVMQPAPGTPSMQWNQRLPMTPGAHAEVFRIPGTPVDAFYAAGAPMASMPGTPNVSPAIHGAEAAADNAISDAEAVKALQMPEHMLPKGPVVKKRKVNTEPTLYNFGKPPERHSVWVGFLAKGTTLDQVAKAFIDIGPLMDKELKNGGAVITFNSMEDRNVAICRNGLAINGQMVHVRTHEEPFDQTSSEVAGAAAQAPEQTQAWKDDNGWATTNWSSGSKKADDWSDQGKWKSNDSDNGSWDGKGRGNSDNGKSSWGNKDQDSKNDSWDNKDSSKSSWDNQESLKNGWENKDPPKKTWDNTDASKSWDNKDSSINSWDSKDSSQKSWDKKEQTVFTPKAWKEQSGKNWSDWNNNNRTNNKGVSFMESDQLEIPKSSCRVVIGKGGETIKRLEAESGAKIQVDSNQQDTSTRNAIVRFIGPADACAKARKLVQDLFSREDDRRHGASSLPVQQMAPPAQAQQQPLAAPMRPIMTPPPGAPPQMSPLAAPMRPIMTPPPGAPPQMSPPTTAPPVSVPQRKQQSGDMRSVNEDSEFERLCAEMDLAAARDAAAANKQHDMSNNASPAGKGTAAPKGAKNSKGKGKSLPSDKVDIPSDMADLVAGKDDAEITRMQEETGARIQLDRGTGPACSVRITGSLEGVQKAKRLVQSIVSTEMRKRLSKVNGCGKGSADKSAGGGLLAGARSHSTGGADKSPIGGITARADAVKGLDSTNGPSVGGDRPIGAVAGKGGPIRSFVSAAIGTGKTSTTPSPVVVQLSKPELQTVTQAATPLVTRVVPFNALKSAKGMQDKPREEAAAAAAVAATPADAEDEFTRLCEQVENIPSASDDWDALCAEFRGGPEKPAVAAATQPPKANDPDEFDKLCAEIISTPPATAVVDDFETLCADLGAAPAEHIKNDARAPASTAVVALDNQAEPAQDSTDEFAKLCEQLEASADCNDSEFAKVCEAAAESNDAEFAKLCEEMGATAPEEASAPPTKRAKT